MPKLRAEEFIRSVDKQKVKDYLAYWETITPKNDTDYYLRWLFSFCSIHTTWKKNVDGFNAVRDLGKDCTYRQLKRAVNAAKIGLDKMRTFGIYTFTKRFYANPKIFYPLPTETMQKTRDRLAEELYGIGLTKTSFLFELSFPVTCEVVCLDTHILQLYGSKKTTPNKVLYAKLENHWLSVCKEMNVPSPIVRHMYWDKVQNKSDTRYWSYVFEK